jgi:hypothetical protein
MRPSKGMIPARACAAVILLLACILSQAVPWPPHARAGEKAVGEAAAAAIALPQARETCPHHPEGCPPDCLCPKDRVDAGAADAEYPSGAALSRCAGKTLADAPAAGGLFLPEDPVLAVLLDPFSYLTLPAPCRPAPGFRAESGKIPIA